MTLADIRNSITLLIIGLYMILMNLNAGFMLIRVPPAVGSGVLWETQSAEDWQLRCS